LWLPTRRALKSICMSQQALEDRTMSSPKSRKKKNPPLPEQLEEKLTRVNIGPVAPINAETPIYHSVFKSLGFDNSFDIEEFKENFKIKIISLNEEEIVFDMIGIDAAIANAFRRILISEVPTMAIERVVIRENTSIIQDEVLAHRLGLIPIKADPRQFEYFPGGDAMDSSNTIAFSLNITCERNPEAKDDAPEEVRYINSKVYSRHLEYVPPTAGQTQDNIKYAPVAPDILIAKLRPGQTISLMCYCVKGIGKDHAKFSPVATAFYRLMPEIKLLQEIRGKKAKQLVDLCPMKVFDIEDLGNGEFRAYVARPRQCTMCRECIREQKWQNKVQLGRVKDHFICSFILTNFQRLI